MNVKVKVIPQQAEVPQGVPGRLRPRIFLTFRHYKVGRSSAKRTGRLHPRRNPWYSYSEAESTPGHMVPSGGSHGKKFPVTPPGIDPGTLRLVAQCLNHHATPGPAIYKLAWKNIVEPDRTLMKIFGSCAFACWISTCIDTHSRICNSY